MIEMDCQETIFYFSKAHLNYLLIYLPDHTFLYLKSQGINQ